MGRDGRTEDPVVPTKRLSLKSSSSSGSTELPKPRGKSATLAHRDGSRSTIDSSSSPARRIASLLGAYSIGECIGQGAYAMVFDAFHVSTGDPVAIKVISPKRQELNVMSCEREIQVMEAVAGGSHVVQLLDSYLDVGQCVLVQQLCECDVLSFLRQNEVSEGHLSFVMRDTFSGLAHIHSRHVVHRDIKPENLLVTRKDCRSADAKCGYFAYRVMLADFGLAAQMRPGQGLRGIYGSAPYMCPEMVSLLEYNDKVDTWSAGAMTYIILTGMFPHRPSKRTSRAMKQAIRAGPTLLFDRADLEEKPSAEAMAFTEALMQRDAGSRKNASQALQMPFLSESSDLRCSRSLGKQMASATAIGAFSRTVHGGKSAALGGTSSTVMSPSVCSPSVCSPRTLTNDSALFCRSEKERLTDVSTDRQRSDARSLDTQALTKSENPRWTDRSVDKDRGSDKSIDTLAFSSFYKDFNKSDKDGLRSDRDYYSSNKDFYKSDKDSCKSDKEKLTDLWLEKVRSNDKSIDTLAFAKMLSRIPVHGGVPDTQRSCSRANTWTQMVDAPAPSGPSASSSALSDLHNTYNSNGNTFNSNGNMFNSAIQSNRSLEPLAVVPGA